MPIRTPGELQRHLELAIQIELSTIPPYLYAMYSIEDQTSESALLIRSIVAEEMLHAVLASNLLVAIGGTPQFASPSWLPSYPLDLPNHRPPLRLDLAPCSMQTIREVFMRIEQPELHEAPPQADQYETLGQFYHAIEISLSELSHQYDLFNSDTPRVQMSDPSFYAPVTFDKEDSGGLLAVHDLDTAIEAIEIIIHQGEGLSDEKWADESHKELTHYHKLLQISQGSSPLGAVKPVPTNPRRALTPIVSEPCQTCSMPATASSTSPWPRSTHPARTRKPSSTGSTHLWLEPCRRSLAFWLARPWTTARSQLRPSSYTGSSQPSHLPS